MKNKSYPLYQRNVHGSLAAMLETNAREVPQRVAIRQRKGKNNIEEISYLKLYEDVKRAVVFVSGIFGMGNHIAIIGENSYEWLLAFLAVACSGNVAVPVDKELPADEVKVLLDIADVNAAFVSKTYSDLVENIEGLKVMPVGCLREIPDVDLGSEFPEIPWENIAGIFFTSGTTGRSKGVMLTHGNILSEINLGCQHFDPEGDVTVAMLPFNHAFGLINAIFNCLGYQITIFITKSLKNVQKDIKENKPSLIMAVPLFVETFYKSIMANAKQQGKKEKLERAMKISDALLKVGIDLRRKFFADVLEAFGDNLKWLICGGAPLDPYYIKFFRSIGVGILNGYGTTECSPCIAANRNHHYKDGSVGQVIAGNQVRVAADGELEIKGPLVMKGYYNNPAATAEVFSEDGWYKTGDLGYIDEDNFIFLTGRKKNLIILSNGENISPEELEADFSIDEAVQEVLVYPTEGKLIAEIYPADKFAGDDEYFTQLMLKVNRGRPLSKQIASVKLRDTEFIKNTTHKIVRSKNIPK